MIANDTPQERRIIWPKAKTPATTELDKRQKERDHALANARLEIKALRYEVEKIKERHS